MKRRNETLPLTPPLSLTEYFNSPPPDFPTHQICPQKDHFDDDCYPRHHDQSSVSTHESCKSTFDQQFKLDCPVILQNHETPLQCNSDVEIHTGESRGNDGEVLCETNSRSTPLDQHEAEL
jgi:hypothetical protein